MELLENYYHKQTFAVYSMLAIVPGKGRRARKIFAPASFALLMSMASFQILKFLTDGFTLMNAVDLLPSLTGILIIAAYIPYTALATEKSCEMLLRIMWTDLQQERSKEENAIKEKYASHTNVLVRASKVMLSLSVASICTVGLVPSVLNQIIPGNHTWEKQLIMNLEMFIDQKKYFYYIYFLESGCVAVMGICVFASNTIYITVIQHLCGMFETIRYHLKNLPRAEKLTMLNKDDYVNLVTRSVNICIEIHQKTLHLAVLATAYFDIPMTLALIGSAMTLTVALAQTVNPELITAKMVIYTSSLLLQLSFVSYIGQMEINASEKIFDAAYNTEWHIFPPYVRRALQLMILRSSKPCEIVGRKLYTLSAESYLTTLQATMSIFMVLRNFQ